MSQSRVAEGFHGVLNALARNSGADKKRGGLIGVGVPRNLEKMGRHPVFHKAHVGPGTAA